MIVVDASALVEALLRTPTADAIEMRLFGARETLHAPHLLDIEVAQVIRRYVATGDIDQERGPLWTWFRYGESASRSIVVFFLPWVINPHQNHPWVSERLGLTRYPIIYRQLSTPVLGSGSSAAEAPRPAIQAQAS